MPDKQNTAAMAHDVPMGDIELDPKAMTAKFVRVPEFSEVPYPVKMEPNLVIEFYAS